MSLTGPALTSIVTTCKALGKSLRSCLKLPNAKRTLEHLTPVPIPVPSLHANSQRGGGRSRLAGGRGKCDSVTDVDTIVAPVEVTIEVQEEIRRGRGRRKLNASSKIETNKNDQG